MPKTEDGFYIKDWLDLYARTNGRPTVEDRNRLAKEDADLEEAEDKQDEKGEEEEKDAKEETDRDKAEEELICGYTMEELMQMDFDQIWEIVWNCDEF